MSESTEYIVNLADYSGKEEPMTKEVAVKKPKTPMVKRDTKMRSVKKK